MPSILLPSAYLPPVSFFTAINSGGDVLIEQYDNYCKQTYRNRCRIATAGGVQTLTVPVVKSNCPKQLMKDVRISDHGEWRHQHWNALESAYMNSPFFMYYQDDFRPFYEKKYEFLIDFNTELTIRIMELAGIHKQLRLTESYTRNTEGITDLRAIVEPSVQEPENPKTYWQVFKQKYGFLPNLSAVDLLFNMGPEFTLYTTGAVASVSNAETVNASAVEHNSAINLMKGFMDNGKPKVGIFWYDYVNNALFGVEKGDVEKYMDKGNVVTYPKLHKTYWQKQHYRAVANNDTDSIFYKEHNYTLIPRGEVFWENGSFYVNVGSWVNGIIDGQQCININRLRELIIDEFNLPEDFVFRIDRHWDIGHGWSEERFE